MAPTCKVTKAVGGGRDSKMPSLFRFLFVVGTIGAVITGTLYILANKFEPQTRTVTKPVQGVKVRTE